MKTLCLLPALFVFAFSSLKAQNKNEVLYVQKDFQAIIENTSQLKDTNDYYWNAIALKQTNQTLQAINILHKGLISFPLNKQLERLLAEYLFQTGQYTAAKPLLKKYRDESPFFIYFINVLEFEGNYKLAISLLRHKTKTDSLNFFYLKHLAENYDKANDPVKAVKTYEKLIAINPNDLISYLKKARLEIQMQEFKATIATCDTALQIDTANTKLIKLKGVASFNLKDYKTSQNCFSYLYSKGDSSQFILKHLGISEFKNHEFHISRKHLLDAYQLDSNDYEVCYMLGRCYLNSPTPKRGLYYYSRVDSIIYPKAELIISLYFDKSAIYSGVQEYDSVIYCYQKVYNISPKPEYLFHMAMLCQNELKDKKQALKYYNEFLQAIPPKSEEKSITERMRGTAETNITKLKEELFFEGKDLQ